MSALASLLITTSLLALGHTAPTPRQNPEDILRRQKDLFGDPLDFRGKDPLDFGGKNLLDFGRRDPLDFERQDSFDFGRKDPWDFGEIARQLRRAKIAHKVSGQKLGTGQASAAAEDKSYDDIFRRLYALDKKSAGTPEVTAEEFNIMDLIQLLLKLFSMFNQSGGDMGQGGDGGDGTSNTGLLGALGNILG